MQRRFRAPSPALVISVIALFVALGGTSYAAIHLPKNSVGSKQLKKNAVTGAKIKKGAVTSSKLANGSVTSSKIATDAVGTGSIAPDAVTTGVLADKSVTTEKIADKAVTTGQIDDAAVGTTQLAAAAVTAGKLGSLTVRNATNTIPANSQLTITSSCNAGERIIGIGYVWGTNAAGLYAEDAAFFLNAALVRGTNATGAAASLTVQAYCLAS
jgi:hypothetical protein